MRSILKTLLVAAAVLVSSSVFAQQMRFGDDVKRPMSNAVVGPDVTFIRKVPRVHSAVMGWYLTGTNTDAYEVRCDAIFTDCQIPVLRTRMFSKEPLGMGSITHSESAIPWRGQRVEVRAELKGGAIEGWAGVWMRIDDSKGKALVFDNMQTRPLRGTTAFDWHSVVLDVPADAVRITFGVLLHGPGAVFVREVAFESVGPVKPSTDLVAPLRAQSSHGVLIDG